MWVGLGNTSTHPKLALGFKKNLKFTSNLFI